MNRFMWRVAAACAWGLGLGAVAPVVAADLSYAEEFTRKIEAAKALGGLGEDLFGDATDWNTGQTTFRVVDIDLPGNSGLPVQLARTLSTAVPDLDYGGEQLGDWALDLPYVSGVFSKSKGWPTTRCSSTAAPPSVTNGNGKTFSADEYWRGNVLHLPGRGTTHLLKRSSEYTATPSDGKTYTWVTRDHTQFTCGPSIANGGSGEGFIAVMADGLRYTFDWMLTRTETTLVRDPAASGGDWLDRQEVRIYATKVEDRFGNWVQYQWSGSQLTGISANDGRSITLSYDSAQQVETATAHGNTWTYGYSSSGGSLASVTLPDSSRWSYSGGRKKIVYSGSPPASNPCTLPPTSAWNSSTTPYTLTMVHPSGAFTFSPMRVSRTVPQNLACSYAAAEGEIIPGVARAFDGFALTGKALSGPAMSAASWSVAYGAGADNTRTATLTRPDGSKLRYTFGTEFYANEGKLLLTEVLKSDGTEISQTQTTYATEPVSPAYAYRVGYTGQEEVEDAFGSVLVVPVTETEITQNGDIYSTVINSFDSYARPTSVTRSNSLGATRTDVTAYHDNTAKWVLGQVASVTNSNTGAVPESTTYNSSSALPYERYAFGRKTATLAYNTNGTLQSVTDGLSHATTLSDWKRGLPQTITYTDSTTSSAAINDLGWITSTTNELSAATSYGYDAMGRIASITYPTGDTVTWTTPTQAFVPVSSTEYGLPAGHWRQTVTVGSRGKQVFFDALWRPVLTRDYDSSNATGTQRFVKRSFDYQGQETFASYLSTSSTPTAGIYTDYDALGRVTGRRTADGITLEQIAYLSGNRRQITDADGKVSTISYQAFGEPDYSRATNIVAPELQTTTMVRDRFGKITSVSQFGEWSGGYTTATRSFTYDSYQRPCRRIDPESGSTVWGYDAANQVIWEAKGQTGSGCLTSSPSGATLFSYDARGRKTRDNYPGTAEDVSYSYDATGNLTSVANATATWAYTYNKRNLTETAQASIDGKTFTLNPTYNGRADASSLATPGQTISYSPDVWGRPKALGSSLTSIAYHPNGLLSGYTLGNGLTYSQTLNARQWPDAQDTKNGSTSVQKFSYSYSNAGDLTILNDQLGSVDDLTATYDDLHRLETAGGLWGSYGFVYDTLNNLRSRTGTSALTYSYSTSNRLTSITGAAPRTYTYNARGEVTSDGRASGAVNSLGQITSINGVASYAYDGHAKRIKTTLQDGSVEYTLYHGDKLVYSEKGADKIDYLSLNGQTLVELKKNGSTTTPTYLHPDLLGSPRMATSSTKAILWQEHYDPYGKKLNGVDDAIGYTGHAYDGETGLTYMQARFYDAEVGRFFSTDPVHFVDDNPFTFNRYSYANNNPYKYTDPSGQIVDLILDIGFIAADIAAIASEGATLTNVAALGADIVGAAVPGATGLGAGVRVISNGADAAKSVDKAADVAKGAAKETGSYTNTHASGKTYDGKGDRARSQTSGRRVENETGDQHVATEWSPASNSREAFKQESQRLDSNGGPQSGGNYNKIESPGKNMRLEDDRLQP